jgi:MFS transporter, OFA family, oxalate/formate antiporter
LIFLSWAKSSACFRQRALTRLEPNLLLYTAKGASAFLVPVANLVKSATGGWHMVFVITAIMNFVVVGLAPFVLKPLRERFLAKG